MIERAHVRRRIVAGPDPHVGDAVRDCVDEPVADRADGDDDRDGHAPFAGGAVARRDRGVGGHVDVGIGQHDHVVLRSAERLHPLAVARAGLVHVAGDRRGADEGHRRDVRVLEDPVHRRLVAVHDVQHAGRNAGLRREIGDQQRRRRVLLGRLQHEGVAGGDRVRQHPERHHRREVERGDAGDDAERLTDRVDVDAGRRLLGELALQQLRDAARELDVLDPACDFAERVGVHLAVLGRDDRGELLAVAVEELAEPEQHLGPPGQ